LHLVDFLLGIAPPVILQDCLNVVTVLEVVQDVLALGFSKIADAYIRQGDGQRSETHAL